MNILTFLLCQRWFDLEYRVAMRAELELLEPLTPNAQTTMWTVL